MSWWPWSREDPDPEVTAVIRLMELDPRMWEFECRIVSYRRPESDQVALWVVNGVFHLQFYPGEDASFITWRGRKRLWRALKELRARQIVEQCAVVEDEGLEERCRKKVRVLSG